MARNVIDESALVDGVVRRTGLSPEDAQAAVMAVASELGEALTWGEAYNVADQLSGGPARAMRAAAPTTGGGNRYSPEMFLRIIAERLGTDAGGAEVRAVAVLLSLRDLLPSDRFAAIVEELPNHAALLGGPVRGRDHPGEPLAGDHGD
jgi:uncharacterized protein (DUF2267 family)